MTADGWTTDGYCEEVISLGIETRLSSRFEVQIPEWAGACSTVLAGVVSSAELRSALARISRRPDRDTLATIARFAGAAALLAALDS